MNLKTILSDITKADHDYHLIDKHDRIAVGVSGGKDSMVLLTALHMYSKFHQKPFQVVGIHIKMGFPNMDFAKVCSYCEALGIEFHIVESKIYDILKLHTKDDKLPCSLCSTLKKGAVVKEAKTYQCTKVAFGHHSNDAVETLFMNMIHGGRIATFAPKMHLSREDITFIRPLLYCYEENIRQAQINNEIPFVQSTCPNEGYTERQEMKEMLDELYKKYPMARNNFLRSLHNEEQVSLWQHTQENITIK